MAIGLTENLNKLLGIQNGGITPTNINPSNLESLTLPDGWEMERIDDLMGLDEDGADAIIDRNTEMSEHRVQAERVLESYEHLIEVEQKLVNRIAKVQQKLAKLEITRDKAYSEWKTLKHQLGVNRRKMGFNHAADVEKENVAYANHQRNYQQKLNSITDTSRSGTEQGSVVRRRFPTPIAV